jgi:hypothetical protein
VGPGGGTLALAEWAANRWEISFWYPWRSSDKYEERALIEGIMFISVMRF